MAAMIGIDPESDGLARAKRLGVPDLFGWHRRSAGHAPLRRHPAGVRRHLRGRARQALGHAALTRVYVSLDLTPAAIGPFCVPVVNLEDHIDAPNLNMVTCGGQATVPIVAAVNQAALVSYAEIVSSISSKSAGPGTRANIDEFTETTATALQSRWGSATKQGGDHPQPGRPADPDAQHGVLPRRGRLRPCGRSSASITAMVDRGAALRAGIQAQAASAVRDVRRRQSAAHPGDREIHRHQGDRDACR